MPSAKNPDFEVPQVDAFAALLKDTLNHAQSIKPSESIEPPLTQADFESQLAQIPTIFTSEKEKTRQNAVIEIATRNMFSSLVVS